MNYKIINSIPNDLLFKPEGADLFGDGHYYKQGDIVRFNPWTDGWHKGTDLYLYRKITKEFIDKYPQYFKEIK